MALTNAFKNRYIKYHISPNESSPFAPCPIDGNDVVLFSVSSEAFPHVSKKDVSIIGGVSSEGTPIEQKNLFELISISEDMLSAFFTSLYSSDDRAILFPLKDRSLLLFTRFLRSSGLGIAVILNFSPKILAALAHSDLADSLVDVHFSDFVCTIAEEHDQIPMLFQAVSYYSSRIAEASFSNDRSILNVIESACNILGASASINLSTEAERITDCDLDAVFSLLLCILSHAMRSTKEINITISEDRRTVISVDFESDPSGDISQLLFCEMIAENMGTSFNLTALGHHFTASFIPLRQGPSPEGFKSGIFINGKRFVNPFLKDIL